GDWISGVGDVNNDNFDDFIIGDYMDDEAGADAGQTYLFLGRPANQWTQETSTLPANASFLGINAGDWSGYSVAGLGDINKDDYNDFIIGAADVFNCDNEGKAYIVLGRPTNQWSMDLSLTEVDYLYSGEGKADGFGTHVAGIGDVNNDGSSDFTISAVHNCTESAGKVYLILHPSKDIPVTSTSTPTTPTTPTTTSEDKASLNMISIVTVLSAVTIIMIRKRRLN
ncbi:MAG: integrin alpha, partial [Promethearchaeota archaeon]